MSRRQIVLGIALLLVAPLELQGGNSTRLWQDGEILSRKTVPVGRTFLRNRFVYRVRGSNCWYLVVSDTPLESGLFVPIKFATDRNRIFIQDADGKERQAHILQKATTSRHR
jgi:hypothetical protein